MRFRFWSSEHCKPLAFSGPVRNTRLIIVVTGWMILAVVTLFGLVPQFKYHEELAQSVQKLNADVMTVAQAVAELERTQEEAGPQPVSGGPIGESLFSGSGLEALNRLTQETGVSVTGFRPIRDGWGQSGEIVVLNLIFEGQYPQVKALLRGLETEPFQVKVQRLAITATEERVKAEVQVSASMSQASTDPTFAAVCPPERIDIFQPWGRPRPENQIEQVEEEMAEATNGSVQPEISYIMDEQ